MTIVTYAGPADFISCSCQLYISNLIDWKGYVSDSALSMHYTGTPPTQMIGRHRTGSTPTRPDLAQGQYGFLSNARTCGELSSMRAFHVGSFFSGVNQRFDFSSNPMDDVSPFFSMHAVSRRSSHAFFSTRMGNLLLVQ